MLQLLASASGGYLAFGEAIPSDHCAIWLDLHLPEICPPHPESHIKLKACRLQCKDPQVVACCNKILLDIVKSQNIPQHLLQLKCQLGRPGDLCRSHKQGFSTNQQHIKIEYNNSLAGDTKQPSPVTLHIDFWC